MSRKRPAPTPAASPPINPRRPVRELQPGERYALLYSDGSMGILAEGTTLEKAEEDRRMVDGQLKERRLEHLSKIAVVRVQVMEVLATPARPMPVRCTCPHCVGHEG